MPLPKWLWNPGPKEAQRTGWLHGKPPETIQSLLSREVIGPVRTAFLPPPERQAPRRIGLLFGAMPETRFSGLLGRLFGQE